MRAIASRPSCVLLHQRSLRNLNRYRRWLGTGKKTILSTRGVLESSNGAPSGGLVKKRINLNYELQFGICGILDTGRIEEPNCEKFTHAVFMRFQQKEDIAEFQSCAYYSKILDEHVKPVSYGSVSVDFESEVEDDIIPLFRRGEDFNYGVEFMLLISFLETASREAMADASSSLQRLISQCSSFIVQATCGKTTWYPYSCSCRRCLNLENGYSHAAVIRFPSFDDFKLFRESNEYKDMWASKFHPIVEKSLQLHFTVDPVGNQLM
nr:unnamed protein product [Digitaria exilis]